MRRSKLVEMIPLDAPCECPYDCVGCKHLRGVVYYGNDDVESFVNTFASFLNEAINTME